MARIKGELAGRCEAAMMGMAQPIKNEELDDVIKYTSSALGVTLTPEQFKELAFEYVSDGAEARHFVFNVIGGDMRSLTVTFDTKDEPYEVTSEDGVLGYVYNYDYPDCSELGYVFMAHQRGALRRIA